MDGLCRVIADGRVPARVVLAARAELGRGSSARLLGVSLIAVRDLAGAQLQNSRVVDDGEASSCVPPQPEDRSIVPIMVRTDSRPPRLRLAVPDGGIDEQLTPG